MASNMSPSRNSSDHHTVTYTADTIGHGHLSSSSITPPSSFLPNPIEQPVASSSAEEPSPAPCLEAIEYLCVICKVLCKNIDEVAEHLDNHELVFTKPGDIFLCRFCTCLFPNCASAFKDRRDLVMHFLAEHTSKLKAVRLEDHLCAVFKDLDAFRDFVKRVDGVDGISYHTRPSGGFDGLRPELEHFQSDESDFRVSFTGSQFSTSDADSDDTLYEAELTLDTTTIMDDWSSNASTYH